MQTFLLALEAALYPTLLAAVVILLSQPRPRRLLGAYLAGGFITSIGLGLLIVFKLKDSNAVSGGGSVLSWGGDLALGERVVHQTAVVDLADQRSLLLPEAQDPASAAVYHAVGGHLV